LSGMRRPGTALRRPAAPLAPSGHLPVHADVPRVDCPTHGVKQIRIPWAEPGSQFTALFERLAIDLLRECSVKGASGLLRITWDEAWGIKARAVRRGLARRQAEPVAHLGVDEKAIAKRHRYLTVVADLDRGRVLYLADDRKRESPDGFWPTLTPAQRDGIAAIAMDMWEPYVQSTQAHLPDAAAKIVFDKFHVVKHLHDAVDQVRRAEQRGLRQEDDDRLTGSKYLWLMRPRDMSPAQRRCSGKTSRSPGRGRSRSAFAPSGTTATSGWRAGSSRAGSGGRRTAGSPPWRR
jgi:transposase